MIDPIRQDSWHRRLFEQMFIIDREWLYREDLFPSREVFIDQCVKDGERWAELMEQDRIGSCPYARMVIAALMYLVVAAVADWFNGIAENFEQRLEAFSTRIERFFNRGDVFVLFCVLAAGFIAFGGSELYTVEMEKRDRAVEIQRWNTDAKLQNLQEVLAWERAHPVEAAAVRIERAEYQLLAEIRERFYARLRAQESTERKIHERTGWWKDLRDGALVLLLVIGYVIGGLAALAVGACAALYLGYWACKALQLLFAPVGRLFSRIPWPKIAVPRLRFAERFPRMAHVMRTGWRHCRDTWQFLTILIEMIHRGFCPYLMFEK